MIAGAVIIATQATQTAVMWLHITAGRTPKITTTGTAGTARAAATMTFGRHRGFRVKL